MLKCETDMEHALHNDSEHILVVAEFIYKVPAY